MKMRMLFALVAASVIAGAGNVRADGYNSPFGWYEYGYGTLPYDYLLDEMYGEDVMEWWEDEDYWNLPPDPPTPQYPVVIDPLAPTLIPTKPPAPKYPIITDPLAPIHIPTRPD